MTHASGTCQDCGGPTGSKRASRCKSCYYQRGPSGDALPKSFCDCGAELSNRKYKQCRTCELASRAERYKAPAQKPSPRLPVDYDDAISQLRTIIGCTQRDYRGPAKRRDSTTERVVVCADLHAPFQHMEAFAAFLEREKGADVCIVAGDLQDHYAISRFLKYEHVPMAQELAAAQMILEKLSETFPIVLCIEGNHDKPRFEKMLYDRLSLDAIEVIRFLSSTGGLSTIEALCRQFTNVELIKNTVDRYEVSWYVQRGDLVVTHAEKFSRVPGSTLRSIEDWVSDFEGTLGLDPWRVLLQAHTHTQSLIPWGADKLLAEIGCLCRTMGYQLTAKIGGRPQRVGWTTLEQTNGVTDLSSVRPFWWEKSA